MIIKHCVWHTVYLPTRSTARRKRKLDLFVDKLTRICYDCSQLWDLSLVNTYRKPTLPACCMARSKTSSIVVCKSVALSNVLRRYSYFRAIRQTSPPIWRHSKWMNTVLKWSGILKKLTSNFKYLASLFHRSDILYVVNNVQYFIDLFMFSGWVA